MSDYVYSIQEAYLDIIEKLLSDKCDKIVVHRNDGTTKEFILVHYGQWIEKKDFIYCSECNEGYDAIYKIDYRHCPSCGARMEGGK